VQDFIVSLIERRAIEKANPARGRFRTFLLAALDHFLTDRKRRETRQKRGGGIPGLSLEFPGGEQESRIEVEGGGVEDGEHAADFALRGEETLQHFVNEAPPFPRLDARHTHRGPQLPEVQEMGEEEAQRAGGDALDFATRVLPGRVAMWP